jgi:hypothetical protein
LGVDRLSGNDGDDVLIGGFTDHDANRAALDSIMATWTNPDVKFPQRVTNLGTFFNAATVDDDGSRDRLEGSKHNDWYIDYLLADTLTGFSNSQDKKN